MERNDAKRPLPVAAPHEVKETEKVRKSGIALFLCKCDKHKWRIALLGLGGDVPREALYSERERTIPIRGGAKSARRRQ